ncbi:MAG: MBL fold metallo-hydrolase [Desulfobacteraceae bacterium]|nr:MAG: MBL fold metallo-hydrolase [Desulfobacteraceae bacterium]
MRFAVLASGSGGNACYVETSHARLLVDAGLSCRDVIRRLGSIGVNPQTLDGVVITHEHFDHIRGVGPLARKLDIPVFGNALTFKRGVRYLGAIPKLVPVCTGETLSIKDLSIDTFTKCHDAADPMGLVLACEGVRLGVITDLGRSTPLVEDRLRGCHALVAEFNHDERMLEEGPYPLELKRRIRGPDGHLSNVQAARMIKGISHSSLAWVALAHLSEINNLPEKALHAVEETLQMCQRHRTRVLVTTQHTPAPMVEI